MFILQRVTVSISFDQFVSESNSNVDGNIICREKGCEGIGYPMTSSAANGGKGNVASLHTYKVCALLCADNSYSIFT